MKKILFLFVIIIFLFGFINTAFAATMPDHVFCEEGDTCIPASDVYSEIGTTGVYGEVYAPYGCTNKDYPLWDEAILNYSSNNDCICHENICTNLKYLESNDDIIGSFGDVALLLLIFVPILLVIFAPSAYIYYDAKLRGKTGAYFLLWIFFSAIGFIYYILNRGELLVDADANLLRKRDKVKKYAIIIALLYVVLFIVIALFYFIGSRIAF